MARLHVLVIALCCLVGYTTGKYIPTNEDDDDGRIVGGVEVNITERPFQVSLRKDNGRRHFCGGSIINEKTVLTAAHCIMGMINLKEYNIVAATSFLNDGGHFYYVAKVFKHEKFSIETLDYDIGIVVPTTGMNFCKVVQPIKLAEKNINLPDGYKLIVSGWGRTIGGGALSEHLKQANAKYVKKCKHPNGEITGNMICAFEEVGETACHGDSGGPLTSADNEVLIGAVSWGDPKCTGKYPVVYARISALRDWIDEHTQY